MLRNGIKFVKPNKEVDTEVWLIIVDNAMWDSYEIVTLHLFF